MRSTLLARVQFPYDEHKSSYFSLCMLVFILPFKHITSIHHTSMDIEIKNMCHARKYMKCTFKYNIQVYELAPLLVCIFLLIPLQCHSIFYLTIFVSFSPPLSIISTKEGSNFRQVGVKPCEVRIIFPNWFNLDYLQKIFNSV